MSDNESEDYDSSDDSISDLDSTEHDDIIVTGDETTETELDVVVAEEYNPIKKNTVTRYHKKIVFIEPENRQTSNIMLHNEMTEAVSIRAKQISDFGNPLVDIVGLDHPIDMAKKELNERKFPLFLRRKIGETIDKKSGELVEFIELWDPNEMSHSHIYKI